MLRNPRANPSRAVAESVRGKRRAATSLRRGRGRRHFEDWAERHQSSALWRITASTSTHLVVYERRAQVTESCGTTT